jgi:hypothetical protein
MQPVNASLIATDLPEHTYISYAGYDWTWVAPVSSTEFVFDSGNSTNILQDPNFYAGWMFIVGEELTSLFDDLSIAHFTDINGDIIQSTAYWNSHFEHVDVYDFISGDHYNYAKVAFNHPYVNFETFYVRKSLEKVPEPFMLVVFAMGLMIFVSRRFWIKRVKFGCAVKTFT